VRIFRARFDIFQGLLAGGVAEPPDDEVYDVPDLEPPLRRLPIQRPVASAGMGNYRSKPGAGLGLGSGGLRRRRFTRGAGGVPLR